MQFDIKNGWYSQLLPDAAAVSFLVGKKGVAADVLRQDSTLDKTLVVLEQTHGANVCVINTSAAEKKVYVPNCDGVITTIGELILSIRVADCLPILMSHSSGVLAAVHAGRKGTEAQIFEKALTMLKNDFGCEKDLNIWFGPAICKMHYQIDKERDTHYDLVGENRTQLSRIFDPSAANLELSGLCTVCNNEEYFSYRGEITKQRNHIFITRVYGKTA